MGRRASYEREHDPMEKLKSYKRLSIVVMGIGVMLMGYMITVEDEPGAVPLLLIIFGSGWYLVTRRRLRSYAE